MNIKQEIYKDSLLQISSINNNKNNKMLQELEI